ncbi:MarR family winged helix-turn-helix transcriptional regulator [Ferruginibacter sp.]|jgi:DNA-binding MarR family transcriptional regulator|uniref:MarR family winged helix-turn-helix transcriptional regulator n=2 Tax=Ferruginibacter sp. TaxID=1940288 RepID=UPI00198FE05C|nr:MarR family transcriptional regulator [Ferruginibacter sp.]MBC7626741.1 MarR family transcriptional regulator [Ferruginibacter sp.]
MDCKEMPDTLGFMIVHTGKLLLKTINGAFSDITKDITFEQLGVLYYLSRSTTKEMIQQDIATIMDKTKSAILRSIDILQEKGFVKRLPVAGDRRKNVIELTSSGKSVVDIMHGKFLGQDGILKEGINEKDLETCMCVLAKIQEKCK